MKFYLPTREECQTIIQNSEAFYCAERVIEGQKVEMYDYRLASLSDFQDNNAFELRGITFVYDEETSTWERHILMNKFFNINQTEGWMYDDVKDKKIDRVQNKEDGSVVSFVKFKNGKIRAKSKMSFESEQAVMAQELFDKNKRFHDFIEICLYHDYTPIFELVGPDNQIVLEYHETKLLLLQIRHNDTGKYMNEIAMMNLADTYHVEYAEDFGDSMKNLGDLLARKEIDQSDIEGWVVTFKDGQMAKIKTDKYLSLHGLIGPDAFRENLLVKTILDGNIDDVISALVPGIKKDRIIELDELVTHKFNHLVVEFKELRRKYFQDFKEVRKDFAIKHSKDELFGAVMKTLKTDYKEVEQTAERMVSEYIERKTNSLGDAKKWIEGLQNV